LQPLRKSANSKLESMKFYELKINYADQENYEALVLQKIKPLIEELEASNLIKGFYFIMHKTLDFRLLIDSEDDLDQINNAISASGLSNNDLEETEALNENSEEYKTFGSEGMEILSKSLELYSRLIIQIFDYKKKMGQNRPDKTEVITRELNHQIAHYFLIQQGIDNAQQVLFSLNDSKRWAKKLLTQHRENFPENQVAALIKIVNFDPFS